LAVERIGHHVCGDSNFSAADLNVDLEASALRNVFRLAEGLPQPQRGQLERQSRAYVAAVLEKDWPGMSEGAVPEDSHRINQEMWRTLMSVKSATASEYVAEDHALSELSELTRHRRSRLMQSESRLPGVLWTVLFAGGFLTLLSVSMFGSQNARLHALQVSSLTLLVTLVMLAIADVDRPFQGWVHVSNYAFERARENLREAQ
jgi:Protein of unknown function (DUF4239)